MNRHNPYGNLADTRIILIARFAARPSDEYNDDRVHLNLEGPQKASGLLLTFCKTAPQAGCCFVTGETC